MKHKCCYCYSICKSSLNNFEKCLTRQSMVYGLSSNSLFQLFSAWGEADYSGIEPMFSKSASARKIEIRQLRKRKVHYIVRSLDFRLLNRSICLQRPQNSTTLSLKFIKLFFFFINWYRSWYYGRIPAKAESLEAFWLVLKFPAPIWRWP